MTEMTPTRWLIFSGIIGILTPWVTDWSYKNLGFPEAFPMIYVVMFWLGAIASLVSICGGFCTLTKMNSWIIAAKEALVALMLGLAGLGSTLLLLVLSMM